jgi:hypothetical protein
MSPGDGERANSGHWGGASTLDALDTALLAESGYPCRYYGLHMTGVPIPWTLQQAFDSQDRCSAVQSQRMPPANQSYVSRLFGQVSGNLPVLRTAT